MSLNSDAVVAQASLPVLVSMARFGYVILSAAKNLCRFFARGRTTENLRVAQGDTVRVLLAAVVAFALTNAVCRADGFDDLVKRLGSTNDETRADAAAKIAQIGGPRAEKQFRDMLASDSVERRQMAVVGLLQVSDDPEDLERVHARLKDDSSIVRWSAALALGESSRMEAIPWLEEVAKNDASDEVREAASQGVTKLQSSIHWIRSLPQALKQARESKKMLLLYFFMRASDICQQFEEGVLRDKDVVSAAQPFVCVRVDVSAEADEARKFDVRGAPSIVIADAQENEIVRAPGLMEKAKLLPKLDEARHGKMTLRDARRRSQEHPDDVEANWKVASNYLETGQEDLADHYLRNVIDADESNQFGHTDDAIFALGFGFGKRGKHAQAVYCMEQLLKRAPQYKDRDKALYCLGLSQLALGKKGEGKATLEKLIAEFPGSGTVKAAKQALEKVGTK